ncbi:MAG: biotin/lipoyl-binding protein [Clostridia bacterium]|nr:biotin/lipoyl-binding protein [Clostridia bacterium]
MRLAKWVLVGILCLGLCSCSLLPVEQEYTVKPVIKNYNVSNYALSYVLFGDVQKTEVLTCRYVSVSTESLAFRIGGEYIGSIYVSKGDMVKKGDLLAELEVNGLKRSLADVEEEITSLELSIERTGERMSLAVATAARIDAVTGRDTASSVREQYASEIKRYEDSLSIARMRRDEYREQIGKSQLRAGIDGAVTYIRNVSEGQKSVEGETFISLADAGNSVFYADTVNYDLLPTGDIVEIYVNKEYLEAEVVSAESLGFREEFNNKGAKRIYFRALPPNASLETGDRGTLTITLEEAKDTLYIPVKALNEVDGRFFVYQCDEKGLKVMTDVVPGIITNKYAEIRSGLSEGDNVITG